MVFTQARKHYMLLLSPAVAIWKGRRVSIEIASLSKIARPTWHACMNLNIIKRGYNLSLLKVTIMAPLQLRNPALLWHSTSPLSQFLIDWNSLSKSYWKFLRYLKCQNIHKTPFGSFSTQIEDRIWINGLFTFCFGDRARCEHSASRFLLYLLLMSLSNVPWYLLLF